VSHKLQAIGGVPVFPITKTSIIDVPTEITESEDKICETASHKFKTDPEILISRLSFSHIVEIMKLDDPFERFFYEYECIRGVWSVRELQRQINTNLYFRAGISKKPELLLEKIQQADFTTQLTVKEPFALEFLGLDDRMAVTESDIENALIDHLQEFLLECGKGLCFEARQKRLLIDGEYFYPDLIFYHRYLHCSVIIDLKDHEFRHEDLGQLNAYVGYYKINEMAPGDNPPIGILLCTHKGPQMVEYALSGMDNQLFVSTYLLHLPDKDQLREFLIKQMEEMEQR
jgi:predicted nuclease of restriction endonuclease-like (RecB) superfamily